MGVGLQPLEFSECLADSPAFRENLLRHEKELERTSQQIKRLIKEVKDVVHAAKRLGAAQLALADSMEQFEFACIGASMTEDERVISRSLKQFAALMRDIESERDRMLGRAHEQIIEPLERFRKEHIGAVKEGKKKFDKKTAKFCQSQERILSLSTKKPESVFKEADATLGMAAHDLCAASAEYVFLLQAVQERKKFELVETLLGFVFGWWTFHHTAHDHHQDNELTVRDLQLRIQRTRSNFEETSKQTQSLMKKMMDMRKMTKDDDATESPSGVRAGYLFLMEKKAFGTTWSKQYASYEPASRTLTLLPYNQINAKAVSTATTALSEGGSVARVEHATATAETERRHCLEAALSPAPAPPSASAPPNPPALTLQALSESAKQAWIAKLNAHLDGAPRGGVEGGGGGGCGPGGGGGGGAGGGGDTYALDEQGFNFVRNIIAVLEERGLTEQGLYRVAGVTSKVSRLTACAAGGGGAAGAAGGVAGAAGGAPGGGLPAGLRDPALWESKTLTSALKSYLRNLQQPLLTRELHHLFIDAAKRESPSERVRSIQRLVRALPLNNYNMLKIVIQHLCKVVAHSDKNLMPVSNISVCLGPTLLRADTETVASILELKFYNVVVETLIEHYHTIFSDEPALEHNGHIGATPAPLSASRNDISSSMLSRTEGTRLTSCGGGAGGGGGGGAGEGRYSLHQQQLLQHFPPAATPAHRPPPPALIALRGVGRSSSSSAESVSSASPPPPPPPPPAALAPPPAALAPPPHPAHLAVSSLIGYRPPPHRYTRVRTLYACLGESEGELSFEPNQIVTNVAPSGEPGWLRGTLNGRAGLVPENYVQPLP